MRGTIGCEQYRVIVIYSPYLLWLILFVAATWSCDR